MDEDMAVNSFLQRIQAYKLKKIEIYRNDIPIIV